MEKKIKDILIDYAKYKHQLLKQPIFIDRILGLETLLSDSPELNVLKEKIKVLDSDFEDIRIYPSQNELKNYQKNDQLIQNFFELLGPFSKKFRGIIVDRIAACKHITELVNFLENTGGKIIEQKVSDPHFRELYFKIKYSGDLVDKIPDFEGIIKTENELLHCENHWSTVQIDFYNKIDTP